MELHQLRAFLAVAEEGNFSRAAARLHICQPPLTRKIHQLEEELGVMLFARTRHGANLTPEGRSVLAKARWILAAVADLQAGANTAASQRTKPTVVKIGYTSGMWELANKLRAVLTSRSAAIELEGFDLRSSAQIDALQRGIIDVGLVRCTDHAAHLASIPLFDEPIVVLLAADHPLANRVSVRLNDLTGEVVLFDDRSPDRCFTRKLTALTTAAGVTLRWADVWPSDVQGPPETGGLLSVAAGKGISFAVRSEYKNIWDVSGIATVPLQEPDAAIEVRAMYRRNDLSPAVYEVVEAVRHVSARQWTTDSAEGPLVLTRVRTAG